MAFAWLHHWTDGIVLVLYLVTTLYFSHGPLFNLNLPTEVTPIIQSGPKILEADYGEIHLLSKEEQDRRWEYFIEKYEEFQEKIVEDGIERFVVYTCTNSGLANKLNGLISGLLIAMVSNRGFKIDEWPSFDSYFDLNLVDHHYNKTKDTTKGTLLLQWHRCDEVKRLRYGYINEEFGNRNIQVYTNCPIGSSLSKNPLYYRDFVRYGLITTAKPHEYYKIWVEISYRLLNYVSLKDSLQAELASIYAPYQSTYLIGLQIRIGIGNGLFLDNCKFLQWSDVDTFIKYANYLSLNRTNVKWFVSTDSPKIEKELMDSYGSLVFNIDHYPRAHSGKAAFKDSDPSVIRALMDNYMLSLCNVTLWTDRSSFGEIAVVRRGELSAIVIKKGMKPVMPPLFMTYEGPPEEE